jgi:DNA ligase-1
MPTQPTRPADPSATGVSARRVAVVQVRPELVVEVACDGVQQSPRYPGGVALRFARVLRWRPDKRPDEADTIGEVFAIHAGMPPREPRPG